MIHIVLARKLRQDFGKTAAEAKGTLGISNRTCEESDKERRTATNAPVAETFNAVANSSSSFPLLSRLRTKTGIASGRRGHLRRSSCRRFRFKWISPGYRDGPVFTAPRGPNEPLNSGRFQVRTVNAGWFADKCRRK